MSRFFRVQAQRWQHWPKTLVMECREHMPDGNVKLFVRRYKPECTCEPLAADSDTRCFVRRGSYEREFGYWKCSNCGCECFDGAKYCMECGAKVVRELPMRGPTRTTRGAL